MADFDLFFTVRRELRPILRDGRTEFKLAAIGDQNSCYAVTVLVVE